MLKAHRMLAPAQRPRTATIELFDIATEPLENFSFASDTKEIIGLPESTADDSWSGIPFRGCDSCKLSLSQTFGHEASGTRIAGYL